MVRIAFQQQLARVSLRLGQGTPRGGGALDGPAREAAARRCPHPQPASHACPPRSPPTCRHCPRCPCCLAPAGWVLPSALCAVSFAVTGLLLLARSEFALLGFGHGHGSFAFQADAHAKGVTGGVACRRPLTARTPLRLLTSPQAATLEGDGNGAVPAAAAHDAHRRCSATPTAASVLPASALAPHTHPVYRVPAPMCASFESPVCPPCSA